MTWLTWTVLYIVAIVAYYFFSKKLFNEQKNVDPRFYGGLLQVAVGIVGIVPALLEGWYFVWNQTTILWLVVVAIVYTIGPSLYYTGLKHTHLSVTTTLDAVGAVYALILGTIVLHEPLNWQKVLGAGLILLAVLIVAGKSNAVNKLSKYEILLLIAPVFYVIGSIADKTLIQYTNASTYVVISFLVAGLTMTGVNLPRLKKVGIESIVNKKFLGTLAISGIFIAVAAYSMYRAFMLGGDVSAMYPIMQTESVIVPFMAMWLFGERERFGNKIVGALLAFGGVVLLS
jgi:drug/metabolite transporter (DMT)-like permease